MFTQIRTSKENKAVVAQLTRKLSLGSENIIARIAYSYSLSQNRKLNISDILDSGGKEYSKAVLFGEFYDLYIGLLCVHYNIYKTDKDIGKYVKLHIDDGLSLINDELNQINNIEGFDFLIEKIESQILNI
jgi:DNA sulfur modification protein DndE